MDERDHARNIAMARMVLGAGFVALPGLAGPTWIGSDARSGGAHTLARGFGARDAILGYGLFRALENGDGEEIRRWLLFGAVADAGDLLGTLGSWRRLPRVQRTMIAAGIVGFGAFAVWLSQQFWDPCCNFLNMLHRSNRR